MSALEATRVPEAMSVLELRDVSKVYRQGTAEVHALAGVSLSVRVGETGGGDGPSGSASRRRHRQQDDESVAEEDR